MGPAFGSTVVRLLMGLALSSLRPSDRLTLARQELEEALALRTRLAAGEKTLDLGISYLNLSALEQSERNFDRALAFAEKSLAAYKAAYADDADHPALWKPHRVLANVHRHRENFVAARAEQEPSTFLRKLWARIAE